jgi:hypothetical protein
MVNVQITMVMRVDDVRPQLTDDRLKALDDLDEWKAVEAVVGQSQVDVFADTEDFPCVLGGSVSVFQIILSCFGARADAVCHENCVHNVSFGNVPRYRAAAAEGFVVGVCGDDQDGLTH